MIAHNTQEDIHLAAVDLEPHWKDFLSGVLATTVELCIWLSDSASGRARKSSPRSLHRRLLSAAVAWRWVFEEPDCELPLWEVCLFLGLSPDRVRSRIMGACKPPQDINQVVARILLECDDAKRKRKTARPCGMGASDWVRLRDYRRQYPFGASFEDFCRFEVGGGEDRCQD